MKAILIEDNWIQFFQQVYSCVCLTGLTGMWAYLSHKFHFDPSLYVPTKRFQSESC